MCHSGQNQMAQVKPQEVNSSASDQTAMREMAVWLNIIRI